MPQFYKTNSMSTLKFGLDTLSENKNMFTSNIVVFENIYERFSDINAYVVENA